MRNFYARPRSLVTAALVLAAQLVLAQTPPTAGELLRENMSPVLPAPSGQIGPFTLPATDNRPALSESSGGTIQVKALKITGATVLPESELQALVASLAGKDASFNDLRDAAERITRHYRENGYALARAYLPAQKLSDGQVEIKIMEGRLGDVRLENKSSYSDADILAFLAPDSLTGTVVHKARLERRLLLLADIPGFKIDAELSPGSLPGTTDLKIRVEGGPRIEGEAGVDNFGNWSVGHYRGSVGMRIMNPGGWGDDISLKGMLSNDRMSFGRVAYQASVGREGTRLGLAYSAMRYGLGQEFVSLGADGDADSVTLSASHPLIRGLTNNVYLAFSFDQRRLSDRVAASGGWSDKKLNVANLSLSASHLGRFGYSSANVALLAGQLKLKSPAAQDQDALGLKTAGHYGKLVLSASHSLTWGSNSSIQATLNGQRAGKNLDSSEKFALGGPTGVRAYPQGEAAGDDAWLLTLEGRQNLGQVFGNTLQANVFLDAGRSRSNHDESTIASVSRTLSGAGIGFSLGRPGAAMLKASIAQRLSGGPATADKDGRRRVWFSYEESF